MARLNSIPFTMTAFRVVVHAAFNFRRILSTSGQILAMSVTSPYVIYQRFLPSIRIPSISQSMSSIAALSTSLKRRWKGIPPWWTPIFTVVIHSDERRGGLVDAAEQEYVSGMRRPEGLLTCILRYRTHCGSSPEYRRTATCLIVYRLSSVM